MKIELRNGSFESELSTYLELKKKNPPCPTFAFIDPYGPSGFPITAIRSVLSLPKSEVLILLMWRRTALSLAKEDTQHHFTQMLGSESWRDLLQLPAREKAQRFVELYMSSLREVAGARIARQFAVHREGKELEYWLIFATNSPKGWEEMKRAMWKIDPVKGERFCDTTTVGQIVLFQPSPDFEILKKQVRLRLKNSGAIPIAQLEEFVLNETAFLEGHLRSNVLVPMQDAGEIRISQPGKTIRKGTFPSDAFIEVVGPPTQGQQLGLW